MKARSLSNGQLKRIATEIRAKIIELSYRKGVSHVGSALSCVDVLTTLYWDVMNIDPRRPSRPNRDRFIMSKGHAATVYFVSLCKRGFFQEKVLDTYNEKGSILVEHPNPGSAPGVEWGTGSLGHGLSVASGIALASRIAKKPYSVFVLMSDGECNEGEVWEAAMFAAGQRLSNLTAIVDLNGWQATGRSREVLAIEPLVEKWRSFGWDAVETDGHDFRRLRKVLAKSSRKPRVVIAHTVKGKGVSFMEDDNNWHYRIPSREDYEKSLHELGLK